MNHVTVLAIDIAKNIFELCAVNQQGVCLKKKRLKRHQLLEAVSHYPVCTIAMESCGSSNYWARQFINLGFEVKLINPVLVKPYVLGNKNDKNDALAIARAALDPNMRYVPIKTVEQQDIQTLHRIRSRLIKNRTQLANQIRGLLAEYGLVSPLGLASLRRDIPEYLEDAENELTPMGRELFEELRKELVSLDKQINRFDKKIEQLFRSNPLCQKIAQIPGIGPKTATIIVSDLGQPELFKNGRHYSAYLGLVPKHRASGNKRRILGISKRGDGYIRQLLVHGARAVLAQAHRKNTKQSLWLQQLKARVGHNRACVALANKNARRVWALLAHQDNYDCHL